jgi:hypothetical protein
MRLMIPILNIHFFSHTTFVSKICWMLYSTFKLRSLWEKIYHFLERSSYIVMQTVYMQIVNPCIISTNAYNCCFESVVIFATPIPLVTNGRICIALYLCNTQKRNAFLSVGIVASNAYMSI